MLIQNCNGNMYEKISEKGNYSLLRRVGKTIFLNTNEYIVAYGLKKYDNGYSWNAGHYFYDFNDAKDYFLDKAVY